MNPKKPDMYRVYSNGEGGYRFGAEPEDAAKILLQQLKCTTVKGARLVINGTEYRLVVSTEGHLYGIRVGVA